MRVRLSPRFGRHLVPALLALSCSLLLVNCHSTPPGSERLSTLHVPDGFEVSLAAGQELVSYPMLGTLDDRGRLFVCQSSGNTLQTPEMAANPDYTINMLEDTDGDGFFDKSTTFADKLTLPAGAVWYRGSLFVASPPDVIRFDDTDGDGVADHREVIASGWNLSSNAASLHGPFMSPDGRLYLTDGRHGFKIKTKEGKLLEGLASRIWRLKPDGSELEAVAGGGFDNPVEIVFTNAAEAIGTMTYFTDPMNGQRDALLHYVEGGVYPKWHPSVSEFKRTGDLMPVITKFARIAPAGLVLYQGKDGFGSEYDGNLFSAQFNPHRIQRHILQRAGATFRTEDQDFLTSSDPDFHPTDVMEDADGSLLVVDTGGWFIHGCPVSRIAKPEIRGAVYRIRRKAAKVVDDPRGKSIGLKDLPAPKLAGYLEDPRLPVRQQALELLVERGADAIADLDKVRQESASADVRAAIVFGLSRIGTPDAEALVRDGLNDKDFLVRIAAAHAVGLVRDREAVGRLEEMVVKDEPPVRRQAATALGRIGDTGAVDALLTAAATADERFIEHSVTYALIQLDQAKPLLSSLNSKEPGIRRAALVALDQMDGSPLTARQTSPFLREDTPKLRETALWVFSHHPDWSSEVLAFLRSSLRSTHLGESETAAVREALLSFCEDAKVQQLIADTVSSPTLPTDRRLLLLDVIDGCTLPDLPASWTQALGNLLQSDDEVAVRVIELIRTRRIASLDGKVTVVAKNASRSDAVRAAAFGELAARNLALDDEGFHFLTTLLAPAAPADLRLSASQALGKAALTEPQLLTLAKEQLPNATGMTLPNLLEAFRKKGDDKAAETMVASLLKSGQPLTNTAAVRLDEILKDRPQTLQKQAEPLLTELHAGDAEMQETIEKLSPLLQGGDVGRGRAIFFGKKAACSSCHTIGMEGGHVGPDLTAVGAIRSGPDILEAVVFPSASFVPGHEVYRVETKKDVYSGVRGENAGPGVVEIISGPNESVRIPRSEIVSMELSKVSLMPDGFGHDLSHAELSDLFAFLQSQKSR